MISENQKTESESPLVVKLKKLGGFVSKGMINPSCAELLSKSSDVEIISCPDVNGRSGNIFFIKGYVEALERVKILRDGVTRLCDGNSIGMDFSQIKSRMGVKDYEAAAGIGYALKTLRISEFNPWFTKGIGPLYAANNSRAYDRLSSGTIFPAPYRKDKKE